MSATGRITTRFGIARRLGVAALVLGAAAGLSACGPATTSTANSSGSAQTTGKAQPGAEDAAARDAAAQESAAKDAGQQGSDKQGAGKKKPAKQGSGSTKSNVMRAGAKLHGTAAAAMLDKLTVKGKAPATGYDRNRWFGKAWAYDFDHNGCRTRDDILARDMTNVTYKNSGMCKVSSGTLKDPYDGQTDHWQIGKNSVDIDHMVALQNAWISGAQYWKGSAGQVQRESIANDPLNLIAADAGLNRAKGAANAAEWLPKNKKFRCQYIATQISVKYKYRLAVTKPEKSAMNRVLNTCPGQRAAKVSRLDIATGSSVAVGAGSDARSHSSGTHSSGTHSSGSESGSHSSGTHSSGTHSSGSESGSHSSGSKSGSQGSGATVSKTVHPGAYCKQTEAGARGTAASGKIYTCKTSSSDSRLRWRR